MFRLTIIAAALVLSLAAGLFADPIHDAVVAGDVTTVGSLIDQNPAFTNAPDTAGNLPIHLAASSGQTSVIALLLTKGANIETGDRENATPLTVACMLNKPDAVHLLVEKGASLSARDNNGNTPLLGAARGGNVELVKYLVERGASLSDVSNRGSNCLHIAASIGAEPLVRYLLDQKLDISAPNGGGYSPIHFAAMNGSLPIVRLLVAAGANIEQTDRNGFSPLMLAASSGKMEVAQALLDLGANVNHAPSVWGHTALYAAIWSGNLEVANLLIDRGADLQYRNDQGETALHIAAAKGSIPIAEMLLSRGFDVNASDNGGRNPICQAIWGQPDMVRWLIEHGSKVDALSDTSSGPLQFAAGQADTNIVRTLLSNGARVDCQSPGWSTPLNIAVRRGNLVISRILLDAGANPNLTAAYGLSTPLHTAAMNGRKDVVELLLGQGATVNVKDSLGRTPLYYATRYGQVSCIDVLKARGGQTDRVAEASDTKSVLAETLGSGEASVWYLGHSGWGIKTKNHFLVFDYYRSEPLPDVPQLANGFIDPTEIAGLPATIFSTHEHADHYDTTIFSWKEQIPNINYVFGHRPTDRLDYTYVDPEESRDLPGMKVSAIRSTDAGVGFIVEVDGLTIFHAGDHAAAVPELPAAFTSEIDKVAARWPKIDLAFLPTIGCSIGTPEAVRDGDIYTLNKLHPQVTFPQHGIDAEYVYREFKRLATQAGVTDSIVCAEHRGDLFRYSKEQQL